MPFPTTHLEGAVDLDPLTAASASIDLDEVPALDDGLAELETMWESLPVAASACTSELQRSAYNWLGAVLDDLDGVRPIQLCACGCRPVTGSGWCGVPGCGDRSVGGAS